MSQGGTRGSAQWDQTDPSREMGHFVLSQQPQSQAKPKPRGGDEEARLEERNRKCRKDNGRRRRRRSDLTSPSQRGEAGGRGRENLNSFISPRRLP